jgi:hypothetical protein
MTQSGTGTTASGERQYNFGSPTSDYFTIESVGSPARWKVVNTHGVKLEDVEAAVEVALGHVAQGDFGDDVVYSTTLTSANAPLDATFFAHFARLLGDQRRISGHRRLGDQVLLDFAERAADPPQELLAPATDIELTLFVPGPTAGPLANTTASGMAEVVAAVCALALGRPVDLPLAIFPALEDRLERAAAERTDPSILGLARDSVSLDIFSDLPSRGGGDALMKARGAFLAYHAAMEQANADVATMLLVTSIEALITPRQEWRKEQVTKRFIDALLILCPETVDAILTHPNAETALSYRRRGGVKRQRRDVLSGIYDLRSRPTHAGPGLSYSGALATLASPSSMRVALLSDLARAAILTYLQAPQSFLTGHPGLRT